MPGVTTAERPQRARATPRVAPGRTPPVRICFLIDELATAGTETQLLALIRHLDRREFAPSLCLLHGDSPASRALEPDDCPVRRLGVGSLCRPSTLMKLRCFARWLRRERIEVLQAYFPDSGYFGMTAAWLAGVPHRIRTRNNIGHWLTPLHQIMGRALNRLTTATVANCRAARSALLEAESPPPDSVVVLENGVDLDRFLAVPPPSPRPPAAPCVGAVANLRPVKGIDVFIRAAARLTASHPGIYLRVAGEGEARPGLERLATDLGVAGRCSLVGSTADIPDFLGRLDVAVLPSRAEGMSNAVLEYMAAGRPVVATAVGATPELIEHGVHGLLVPPDDDAGLAAAVARLIDDRALACRLAAAARRRAVERFSRGAMVRRFEEFYLCLTGRAAYRHSAD
jgi:glycosyltransferase involved in cell wall biosynthesis